MNTKINWAQKLTSRKLWAAIAAAGAAIATAIFKEQLTPEAVTLIKTAIFALCTYIGGESIVDVARAVWGSIETALVEDEADTIENPAEPNAAPSLDGKVEHTIVGFGGKE